MQRGRPTHGKKQGIQKNRAQEAEFIDGQDLCSTERVPQKYAARGEQRSLCQDTPADAHPFSRAKPPEWLVEHSDEIVQVHCNVKGRQT